MENISPTLILLWDIKRALECGRSVRAGIGFFLERQGSCEFQQQFRCWWMSQTNPEVIFSTEQLAYSRKYLLEIIEMGLKGQSILEVLRGYESELLISCEAEIQNHISRLPLVLMIPLMGFIFPALMLLLLGPLLKALHF